MYKRLKFCFQEELIQVLKGLNCCFVFLFCPSLSAAENNFKMHSLFVLLQVLKTAVNKSNQY